ncbi:MAG: hypothetical protein HY711_01220 [Candidatus Melainabacteria bacterium]|nr:hypothetical protein [Candidatus Melainabacteria bacterium]
MVRRRTLSSQESVAKLKAVLTCEIGRCAGSKHKVVTPADVARVLLPLARELRAGRFCSEQEVLLVFCTADVLESLHRNCLNRYWFLSVLYGACSGAKGLPIPLDAVANSISRYRQLLQGQYKAFVGDVDNPGELPASLVPYLVDDGVIMLYGNIHNPTLVWNPLFRPSIFLGQSLGE